MMNSTKKIKMLKSISVNPIKDLWFSVVVRFQISFDSIFSSISTLLLHELLIIIIGVAMFLEIDLFHLLHLVEIFSEAIEMKTALSISKIEEQINSGIINYIYYLVTGKGLKELCVQ